MEREIEMLRGTEQSLRHGKAEVERELSEARTQLGDAEAELARVQR